ncbi:unnamed protein product [Discula destructiva]
MSSIAQDIKSGLKGIKGAGDAIRGQALQAGDELLDPKGSHHPDTAAAHEKNRAIAERGAAEAKVADNNMGARHGVAKETVGHHTTGPVSTAGTVPDTTGTGTRTRTHESAGV